MILSLMLATALAADPCETVNDGFPVGPVDAPLRDGALGAPERESWRMAFGLLVTLVWIYLEFLRLLAIFSRN